MLIFVEVEFIVGTELFSVGKDGEEVWYTFVIMTSVAIGTFTGCNPSFTIREVIGCNSPQAEAGPVW